MPEPSRPGRRLSLVALACLVSVGLAFAAAAGGPRPGPVPDVIGGNALAPGPIEVAGAPGGAAPAPSVAQPVVPRDALYLSPGGSDAGSGGASSPWRSLRYGLTHAPAGATLLLRAGAYGPTGWIGGANAAAAGITIENFPGEAATIGGSDFALLQLENWKNVTIRGGLGGGSLTFAGTWPAGISGSNNGIDIYDAPEAAGFTPTNILIDGVVVHGIAGYGIDIASSVPDDRSTGTGVSDATIRNVEIYDTATGIRFDHAGLGNVVEDSWIHDNTRMVQDTRSAGFGAMGIALDDIQASGASKATPAVVVRDNRISGNSGRSRAYGYDGGAVELFGSSYTAVLDNTMWDNEGGIETGTSSPTVLPVVGNVISWNRFYGRANRNGSSPLLLLRAAADSDVTHNTIEPASGSDVFRVQECAGGYCGSIANLIVSDNIVVVPATGRAFAFNKRAFTSRVVIEDNAVYSTMEGLRAGAQGAFGAPGLVGGIR